MSFPDRNWKQPAYSLFFPAASMHAALVVPLSVYAMTSGNNLFTGLIGPGHGREMLFGFALALVAGYTLGPMPRRQLYLLFSVWLGARLVHLIFYKSVAAILLNAVFILTLALFVVPKFRAAKKWRNRILGPLLLSLCLLPLVYAAYEANNINTHTLLLQAVSLFALLMSFIGGRIIAAAAAGESERRGLKLESRVQPRLEAMIIGALVASFFLLVFSYKAAAAACFTAGCVLLIRLIRWRLWRCLHRIDLIGLGIGYAWLATGLLAFSVALFTGRYITGAVHVITVGALGTLSTGIMVRLHCQHRRIQPCVPTVAAATMLIASATMTRFAAAINVENPVLLLWVSAGCWSAAYLINFFYLSEIRVFHAKKQ